MKSSVEALPQAGKKKGGTANVAFRQPSQVPIPLTTLDPHCLAPSARVIVRRITEINRARGCGAYLFVTDALLVYVVTEEKPLALQWVKDRFREYVGFYAPVSTKGVPALPPTLTGMLEDLVEHLADLKRVAA